MRNWWVLILAVLVAAGGWWGWYRWLRTEEPILFRTETVSVADLARSISATGTVEPEELINVGAQVAGQIILFGIDCDGKTVDYGSRVNAGDVLARIDDALYQADLKLAQSAVHQARSQIEKSEAELKQLKLQAQLAGREFERAEKLQKARSIAENVYDNFRTAFDSADIAVAIGEAALELARGNYEQTLANLERAKYNVDYCTITSPVDGVIIDRRVNVGQTVVSSMSAPSLFLLAKDLRKMQLWVAVNEADIGIVKPGLPVEFSIDAFPGEKFIGEVMKIRLNAAMTQNVVTYTVEIAIDNSDGRLLPYMTANVQLLLEQRTGVPTLNNAALRWQPPVELVEVGDRMILDMPPPGAGETGHIWVLTDTGLQPHRIKLGMTDGIRTEIVGNAPGPGVEIVNGILSKEAARKSRVSPFLPQARKRI